MRWRLFAILMLASFVSYVFRNNINTAAPIMMADLGLTEIQWGWVIAAFMTGYALFQLPGGILGDRFGPRWVVTVIAVLWAVTNAAVALVPGAQVASVGAILTSLILVRFFVGIAHAPIYPATNPVIVNWFPVGGWALPCGLSSTALNLGVAASTPVLAWSLIEFGWRASLLYMSPLGLVVAALMWWYARDKPEEHRSVNQAEIDLIAAGRDTETEADDAKVSTLDLLKNRDVRWLTLSYFCMNYTFYVVFSWFFYFLVEVRGFSLSDAGWLTSAQWIAGAIGAAASGWYCDRLCRRKGLRLGCRLPIVIAGIASAICLIGGVFHPSPAIAMFLLVACVFFNQAMDPPYWTASMSIGGKASGGVGGMMNTGGNISGIVSAVLLPWFAANFGWSLAITSAAVFSLLAAFLMLFVRPERTMAT